MRNIIITILALLVGIFGSMMLISVYVKNQIEVTKTCSDFISWNTAQIAFEADRTKHEKDGHYKLDRLDGDNDGIPCEILFK